MKWNKYTIETTTAAEDYLSSALMDLGIEGVQIEDNVPLTKGKDNHRRDAECGRYGNRKDHIRPDRGS